MNVIEEQFSLESGSCAQNNGTHCVDAISSLQLQRAELGNKKDLVITN